VQFHKWYKWLEQHFDKLKKEYEEEFESRQNELEEWKLEQEKIRLGQSELNKNNSKN
jgi:hypothetical protein